MGGNPKSRLPEIGFLAEKFPVLDELEEVVVVCVLAAAW